MTTTVTPIWETAPDLTPLVSGLLDHAAIKEGIEWGRPTGLGTSFNCLDTAVPTAICPEGAPATKDFSGPVAIDGFTFAVYGGIACKPFGFDEATGKAEIERVFALKETRGVERALMETRFQQGPQTNPGADPGDEEYLWTPAVDITPSGGASARAALAILEGMAVSEYAGQPTLHIPYTLGAYLAQIENIISEGGKFYTKTGAKVVLGAGYEYPNVDPTGSTVVDGSFWMYASGEVVVARNTIETKTAIDQYTNNIYALAERQYIVAVDCPTPLAINTNLE